MSGKVELSIERYEELTSIERNHEKKMREMSERFERGEIGISVRGNSCVILHSFLGKDEFIKNLEVGYKKQVKDIEREMWEYRNANTTIHNALGFASFGKRLKYLLTGSFDESSI